MSEPTPQEVKQEVSQKNALAIAETLVHHGEVQKELFQKIAQLEMHLNNIQTGVKENRQMIVTALQTAYGHGSTERS